MTWHPQPGTRIWRLIDASGAVLATLEHDAESGQYKSGGVLLRA